MSSDSRQLPKSQSVTELRSPTAAAIRNQSSDWELNPSRRAVEHGKLVKRQKPTIPAVPISAPPSFRINPDGTIKREIVSNNSAPAYTSAPVFVRDESKASSSQHRIPLSQKGEIGEPRPGQLSQLLEELASTGEGREVNRCRSSASAEGDLMITGPALCLYFAALRSTTNPPSVPLPRTSQSSAPIKLSYENCPPAFISFLRVWADTVEPIQALVPEQQHDLARIICGLEPLHPASIQAVSGTAADLRAVAIEISQRRSFQDRYAADLQAALDAGNTPGSASPRKTSFVPPPMYDPTSSPTTPVTPSRSSLESRPGTPGITPPGLLSPYSSNHRAASTSGSSITSTSSSASTTPSILTQDTPALELIRETLYASLADVLERQPSLHRLLKRDPPRAYFASVAFAILDVASTAVTPDGAIIGVLGKPLTLEDCPRPYKPLMKELAQIGEQAKQMDEEDTQAAIELAQQGREIPVSRLDRVRLLLEEGIGSKRGLREAGQGRRSVESRAVAFTNRINALSLGMTRLKPFRDRQEAVFEVLAAIGSS